MLESTQLHCTSYTAIDYYKLSPKIDLMSLSLQPPLHGCLCSLGYFLFSWNTHSMCPPCRPQPLASEGQGHLASKALKKKGAPRPTERAPRPFSNLYLLMIMLIYFPLISRWWSTFQPIFISLSLFTCCAMKLNKSLKIFVSELFTVFLQRSNCKRLPQ